MHSFLYIFFATESAWDSSNVTSFLRSERESAENDALWLRKMTKAYSSSYIYLHIYNEIRLLHILFNFWHNAAGLVSQAECGIRQRALLSICLVLAHTLEIYVEGEIMSSGNYCIQLVNFVKLITIMILSLLYDMMNIPFVSFVSEWCSKSALWVHKNKVETMKLGWRLSKRIYLCSFVYYEVFCVHTAVNFVLNCLHASWHARKQGSSHNMLHVGL